MVRVAGGGGVATSVEDADEGLELPVVAGFDLYRLEAGVAEAAAVLEENNESC